jgi:hypothetical protein
MNLGSPDKFYIYIYIFIHSLMHNTYTTSLYNNTHDDDIRGTQMIV